MGAKFESSTYMQAMDVVATMPFGCIILGPDGNIVLVNNAALGIFGYEPGELTGQPLETIVPQVGGQSELGQILFRMKQRQPVGADGFEGEIDETNEGSIGRCKSKRRFAIEVTPWDLPPEFEDLSAIIIRDIDEETERDNRYRILFDSSDYPQLIIINNKFEFANEAAVQAFGCDSVEDLKSIHPSQISPEFQPDGRDSFSKAEEIMSIAYETGGHRFDWVHTKKNGVEMLMDVILTSMPHMGEDALYCGYRDITERQKTEDVLRRTQKMDAIGQLTGGIAHDYNNILGVIKGNLELLKRKLPDDEFAQGRIQAALVGTVRGSDITRKLLAFSHERSRGTKRIRLNQPIREFETLIGKSLTASISIDLALTKNLWPVDVDPGDFDNVILNLALNARDAMPEGGTLTIATANKTLDDKYVARNAGAQAGEFVMIAVGDTGHGMSEEVVEKIFEPFFTTKPEGKGTGLGMSMVYGFVKQSSGHIKVYSKPGLGTTFRIYLPRALSADVTDVIDDEEDFVLPRGTETVLVVDDEEALLEVTCAQLEDLGYTTFAARNGREALEILTEQTGIHAMFSDVVMPGGMDGFQLAAQVIRKRPGFKVQLTSGFTKQYEEDATATSDDLKELSTKLLRKPFNQRELALAIRHVLDEGDA